MKRSKWKDEGNTARKIYLNGLVSANISLLSSGYKAAIYGWQKEIWSPYFDSLDEAKEWCDTTMKQLISEEE